jgi:phage shock protein PspC (stress-responsive transcriptional regulator)
MSTSGKKRFMRPTDGRMLAGVANGIATYFGIDPTIIRLGFALLTLFGIGSPIIIYLLLWIVMPDQARIATDTWEEASAFEGEIDYEGPGSLGDDVHEAVGEAVTQATHVGQEQPVPRGSSLGDDVHEAVDKAVGRATGGSL